MGTLPCLPKQNGVKNTGRYGTEKLPPLLPKVQEGKFDWSKGFTSNRHHRARRFKRRADEWVSNHHLSALFFLHKHDNPTESQSTAILLSGRGKRGVANSTYYAGLDLGMALGPFLGGILHDAVPNIYFYPCLMICIPISILVFVIWHISTLHKK